MPKKIDRTKAALAFLDAVDRRENAGLPIFGDYAPATDKRVMSQETIEEVEDGGVYQRFFRKKWRARKEMVENSHSVTFHLYKAWCLLQEQKRMEDEVNQEKGG